VNFGKKTFCTLGSVSSHSDALAALARNRSIACRVPPARIARHMMARTNNTVFPERAPP
jgi:hypothetical protein